MVVHDSVPFQTNTWPLTEAVKSVQVVVLVAQVIKTVLVVVEAGR